jgi:hypothetical protein
MTDQSQVQAAETDPVETKVASWMPPTANMSLVHRGICGHDKDWPRGVWCGGVLTRHIDGGRLFCEAGHKFD